MGKLVNMAISKTPHAVGADICATKTERVAAAVDAHLCCVAHVLSNACLLCQRLASVGRRSSTWTSQARPPAKWGKRRNPRSRATGRAVLRKGSPSRGGSAITSKPGKVVVAAIALNMRILRPRSPLRPPHEYCSAPAQAGTMWKCDMFCSMLPWRRVERYI